jgi:hypothetical protein
MPGCTAHSEMNAAATNQYETWHWETLTIFRQWSHQP